MRKNAPLIIVLFFILSYTTTSCNEFRKIQKSDDWKLKYTKALEYYKKADYFKSISLFESILPLMRGKPENEEAQFYYAYAHYKDKQYLLSAHYFKTFYETYSRSEHATESQFMYAYSLYQTSPLFSLDQTSTKNAINAFQTYINKNPDSEFIEEANNIIHQLHVKLETKAYENAKEYYKIGYLKSAKVAFENFAKDYPDSKFNEELKYLKIEATFNLAKKSIPSKKEERFHEVIKLYEKFIDRYPNSSFQNQAKKHYNSAINQLEKKIS